MAPPVDALNVVCLADVEPEDVEWLWPGYIPYGKLTVIEGDPGLGKSTVTLAIAAALTGGKKLPGMTVIDQSDVVLITYEDGLADTLRPRLDAAGADTRRIYAVQGAILNDGDERLVELPSDTASLTALVDARGVRVVIIDPLMAALSGKTDSYKDADVRRALAPLARMAEYTGCALIVVRHLSKASTARAIAAGGGSIGISGQARAVLAVHQDPDLPEDPSARVLAVVKCNLAERAQSLRFRLAGDEHGAAYIKWEGESKHTADGLSALRLEASEGATDREVDAWLRSELEHESLDRKEVFRRASDQGFSTRTVDRAANRLGVHRSQSGFGKDKRSMWALNPAIPAINAMPADASKRGADATVHRRATVSTTGATGAIGGNGRIDDLLPRTFPTRVVEKDGKRIRQELHLTQHGNKWLDMGEERLDV